MFIAAPSHAFAVGHQAFGFPISEGKRDIGEKGNGGELSFACFASQPVIDPQKINKSRNSRELTAPGMCVVSPFPPGAVSSRLFSYDIAANTVGHPDRVFPILESSWFPVLARLLGNSPTP
jgi:hypothetical protein